MRHWLIAHWIAARGSITAFFAVVAALWGRVMAFLKPWFEMKEARAKHRRAELELAETEREHKVKEMMRKIEAMEQNERDKHPGKNIVSNIIAAPGDDPEIFREAKRRIADKKIERTSLLGRFRLRW